MNIELTKPNGLCWGLEEYCKLGVVVTDNIFYFMDLDAIHRQIIPISLYPVFPVLICPQFSKVIYSASD